MEEERKKENKINKSLIIAIVVAVIMFGIGFLIGSLQNNKEEKKEDNKVANDLYSLPDGEIDINNEEVQKYINMYKLYDRYEYKILLENAANGVENARLTLATNLLKDSDISTIDCKSLNKENITKYFDSLYADITCGETSIMDDDWDNNTSKTSIIKKDTIEQYLKYYFGENTSIIEPDAKFENLKSEDCSLYYYQSDIDSYVLISSWCGGTELSPNEKIDKVTKQNDLLIIESTIEYDDSAITSKEKITLKLKYEKSTNHYIFDSRKVVTE